MSLGRGKHGRRQGGEGGNAFNWSPSELVKDQKEEGSGKHMSPSGKGDVKSLKRLEILQGVGWKVRSEGSDRG